MFSVCRFGALSGLRIADGVRTFAKSVTQREIYDTLNRNHTILTIPAFKRDKQGTNYSYYLRKNGAIPGVLYGDDGEGHKERVLICVPTNEVDRFVTRLNLSLECTLFYLDVEGEKTLVFPRQLSCHPTTERPESLNFIRLNKKKGTIVQIPIHCYNHDKNREIKMGGFLSTATRFIDVRVKGDVTYVPPFINCNIENLTHKKAFGVEQLEFDRTKFIPHPKMYSRVFASISGKVKDGNMEEAAAASSSTATTESA